MLCILVALYCVGYLAARSQKYLVHRVGYQTCDGRKSYNHFVDTGDFGPGILQPRALPYILTSCYLAFTPLRWLEIGVWHFIPRKYAFRDGTTARSIGVAYLKRHPA